MDALSGARDSRAETLSRLKNRIAAVERSGRRAGAGDIPLWTGVGAPLGVLHEVRAASWRDGPAAAGFSLALAARIGAARRGRLVLIEGGEGERGRLYGRGLGAFGLDPARLLFIRMRTKSEGLWAAEEAARDRGVAAVLLFLEGRAADVDFAASRRIHLAAGAGGGASILVRTGRAGAAATPTAAIIRWRIEPAGSARPAFGRRSPGPAAFRAVLEKGLSGPRTHFVEWRHETGDFVEKDFLAERERRFGPALSGAAFPLPVDGSASPPTWSFESGGRTAARAF